MADGSLDEIVVLAFSRHNQCYPEVLAATKALKQYDDLQINTDDRTWSIPSADSNGHTENREYAIGNSRSVTDFSTSGVIGVYQSTSPDQLHSMVRQWNQIRIEHRL